LTSPRSSSGTSAAIRQVSSSRFSAARKAYRSAKSSIKACRLKAMVSMTSFLASIFE